jgi:hypothetical protein
MPSTRRWLLKALLVGATTTLAGCGFFSGPTEGTLTIENTTDTAHEVTVRVLSTEGDETPTLYKEKNATVEAGGDTVWQEFLTGGGVYELRASAPGFTPATAEVTLVNDAREDIEYIVTIGDTLTIDVNRE